MFCIVAKSSFTPINSTQDAEKLMTNDFKNSPVAQKLFLEIELDKPSKALEGKNVSEVERLLKEAKEQLNSLNLEKVKMRKTLSDTLTIKDNISAKPGK